MPNRFDLPELNQIALANIKGTQDMLRQREQNNADMKLRQFLQASQKQADLDKIQAQHQADLSSQDAAIQKAQKLSSDLATGNPGHKYNVGVTKEGVSLSEAQQMPNLFAQVKQLGLDDKARKDLSDRYNKQNGFTSTLQELEAKTNRDGKGGILTNPEAQLKSTGTWQSAVPTGALGLEEMLTGNKGLADERKALERLQIEYQQAKSGMRVTEQSRAQERQAMGWLASGDPALVAKGVRSLAHVVKNSLTTTQAGFRPEIRDAVHQTMGNPLDQLQGLYDDNAPSVVQQQPQAPAAAAPSAGGMDLQNAAMQELKRRRGGK